MARATAVGEQVGRRIEEVVHDRHRLRAAVAGLLVILGCLLVPVAVIGLTLRDEIVDTSQFVGLGVELAEKPTIQAEIGRRVQRAVDRALPGTFAEGEVQSAVSDLMTSDEFGPVWRRVLTAAHPQIEQVLLGRDTDFLQTEDGRVQLDVTQVIQAATIRLGLTTAQAPPAAEDVRFTLYDSRRLADFRAYSDTVVTISTWSAIVAPILLLGALALAPRRGRIVWWIGLGLMAGAVVIGVVLAIGRLNYLRNLDRRLPREVSQAAYDVLSAPFETRARWWFLIAFAILLVGLVATGGTTLTSIEARAMGWLGRRRLEVAGVLGAAVLGVLVWWPRPTWRVVIGVGIAAVVVVVLAAVLFRSRAHHQVPPVAPGATV